MQGPGSVPGPSGPEVDVGLRRKKSGVDAEATAPAERGAGLTIDKLLLIRPDMQQEDAVFRALADPSRRAIFERLAGGESAVKDITAHLSISQPAVSQHLATLRSAGLLSERREGRLVYYRVEPKGLQPLIDWITHHQAFWKEHLDRLKDLLKELDDE